MWRLTLHDKSVVTNLCVIVVSVKRKHWNRILIKNDEHLNTIPMFAFNCHLKFPQTEVHVGDMNKGIFPSLTLSASLSHSRTCNIRTYIFISQTVGNSKNLRNRYVPEKVAKMIFFLIRPNALHIISTFRK